MAKNIYCISVTHSHPSVYTVDNQPKLFHMELTFGDDHFSHLVYIQKQFEDYN